KPKHRAKRTHRAKPVTATKPTTIKRKTTTTAGSTAPLKGRVQGTTTTSLSSTSP
ncbi:MAG: hypothetical protein QOJ25_2001, partial [Solirubrobacteraceae bacterium]|nr:hypothetical protein [Solirubrobacteraceae bacterium]